MMNKRLMGRYLEFRVNNIMNSNLIKNDCEYKY